MAWGFYFNSFSICCIVLAVFWSSHFDLCSRKHFLLGNYRLNVWVLLLHTHISQDFNWLQVRKQEQCNKMTKNYNRLREVQCRTTNYIINIETLVWRQNDVFESAFGGEWGNSYSGLPREMFTEAGWLRIMILESVTIPSRPRAKYEAS